MRNTAYSASPGNLVAGIASRRASAFHYFYWRYLRRIRGLIELMAQSEKLHPQRSQPPGAILFWVLGFVLESIRNLQATPSKVTQDYRSFDPWVFVIAQQSLTLHSTLHHTAKYQQAQAPDSPRLTIEVGYLPCDMQLSGDHVAFRPEHLGAELLVLLADMELHGPTPALQTTAALHAFHNLDATMSEADMITNLAASLGPLLEGGQPSFPEPTYPSCLLARFVTTERGMELRTANHGTNRLWFVPPSGPVVPAPLDSMMLGIPGEPPATWQLQFQPGDQIVMATDGLWGELMQDFETFLGNNRGKDLHPRLYAEAKQLREVTEPFSVDDVTFLTFTAR